MCRHFNMVVPYQRKNPLASSLYLKQGGKITSCLCWFFLWSLFIDDNVRTHNSKTLQQLEFFCYHVTFQGFSPELVPWVREKKLTPPLPQDTWAACYGVREQRVWARCQRRKCWLVFDSVQLCYCGCFLFIASRNPLCLNDRLLQQFVKETKNIRNANLKSHVWYMSKILLF